jgi:uncharacterized membrane protein
LANLESQVRLSESARCGPPGDQPEPFRTRLREGALGSKARPVAKPKKIPLPQGPAEPADALAQVQTPTMRWDIVGMIAAAVVAAWVFAWMLIPYFGYWGVALVAVLTAAVVGFGIYAYRMATRQRELLAVLSQARDAEGRKAAIAQLEAKGEGDAMATMARAQLVLQEDPKAGLAILESIKLEKEAGPVQDEVRANLAFLYLSMGRPKDARPVAELIKLERFERALNPKTKAMYIAVMAEAFARTGKADEARKLLDICKADDPEFGEISFLLYRAQVYTFLATKNRGLMRKAMAALAAHDPNQLAPFLAKTANMELQQAARECLGAAGFQTRPKQKLMR